MHCRHVAISRALILALALLLACLAGPALAETWQELQQQSQAALQGGDTQRGVALAERAVVVCLKELKMDDPRLHALVMEAGRLNQKLGRPDQAKRFYHFQLTIYRKHPPIDPRLQVMVERSLASLANKAVSSVLDTAVKPDDTKPIGDTKPVGVSKTLDDTKPVSDTAVDVGADVAITADDVAVEENLPPPSGEVLVLTPQDPAEALEALRREEPPGAERPIVLDKAASKKLADPCPPSKEELEDDNDDMADEPEAPSLAQTAPPAEVRSELGRNINQLSGDCWTGEVVAAMQGMRLLSGPMSPEQETAFNRMWAPMFDYPSDRAVAWLRTLNPLLVEFQAVQQEAESLLEAAETADYEAEMAAAYENEDATAAALNQGKAASARLKEARGRMEILVQRISALGDPPDVTQEKCQAQGRARKAAKTLKKIAKEQKKEPGKKTDAPQAGNVYKGPDALPKEFFDSLPPYTAPSVLPNYGAIFRSRGIFGWLQGDKNEPPSEFHFNVNADIPGKYPELNIESDYVVVAGQLRSTAWQGRQFNLLFEDKHFQGYDPNNPDPNLLTPQRFEVSGRISEDGRKVEELAIERVRLDRQCAVKTENGHGCLKWGVDPRKFAYTFKDIPLTKATAIIAVQKHIGLWLEYEVRGEGVIGHISRYEPGSLSNPPRSVNSIKVSITAHYGGAPAADKEPVEPDLTAEKIAHHQNNIKWLEGDLARLRQMLAGATDERSRLFFQYQITLKMADLQAEHDAITTIKTGNFTRTPTAWDEMVRSQMLAQGRQMAADIKKAQTNRDRLDRLIAALPPEERRQMRQWADKQLSEKPLDLKKQAEVGGVLAKRVQARAMADQAKADESAAWAQLGMDVCENYQKAAVYTMYATPFVTGGGALAIVYGITSGGIAGYEQGGVKGAVVGATTTALRYWSPKIDYIVTAYEGYQEGGVAGAVQKVATTFVQRKVVQTITQTGLRYQAKVQAARRQAKLDAWRDAKRRVDFKQEREHGKAMVEQHQDTYQRLQAAKRSGAPPAEVAQLQRQLMDQTAAIKHAPHAKGYLKLSATPAQQRAYNATDRLHTRGVVNDLRRDLAAQGVDPATLRFRPMRNAGNSTPGMDLDLAMESTTGNYVMRRDPQTGQTQRLTMYEANALAQDRFNRVYAARSGGRSADASWQQVTTGAHAEAYADCNWLRVRQMHNNGVDPRSRLDPRYAQQAASVTQFKADHMRRYQGMGKDNQNWEIYRGTRKDIDTKIRPLLERKMMDARTPAERAQALKKLQFYMKLSNAMGKADQDPVAADHEIKKLTGLDTTDMVHMVGSGLEALGKWQ